MAHRCGPGQQQSSLTHPIAADCAAAMSIRRWLVRHKGRPTDSEGVRDEDHRRDHRDRKSTPLNSSHVRISYAVFCLKKKNKKGRDIDRGVKAGLTRDVIEDHVQTHYRGMDVFSKRRQRWKVVGILILMWSWA